MGNCIQNILQEPHESNNIASPPIGVNEFKVSSRLKKSKPLQVTNSSAHKGVDGIHISHSQRMRKPLQEVNSPGPSNLQKGFSGINVLRSGTSEPLQERFFSVHSSMEKTDDIKNSHHRKPSRSCQEMNSYKSEEKPQQDDMCASKMNMIKGILNDYRFKKFSYKCLKDATNKFSERNLLGQGGFGDVYKGWIDHCTITSAKSSGKLAVAVKILRKQRPQGCAEWENELIFLSRLRHPNVVELIGYCCDGEHKMLVYEFMAKGSLDARLSKEGRTELNWGRRINIALGSARGLQFLHNAGRPVIHRDLKSSNILIDQSFTPKLSDFGLAKYGPQGDNTHITTRILGTRGYFAPEYIATGHITFKTDVYSFGVVLLELLSGLGAMKRYSDGGTGELANWARPHLSNKQGVRRVLDKKIRKEFRMEEAYDFVKIILQCIDLCPKNRPTMTEVVCSLEQLERNVLTTVGKK